MKRNKEGIRIFSLLASNYLAFTAILVLIFLGTYLAGDLYTGRMLHTPDGEALIRLCRESEEPVRICLNIEMDDGILPSMMPVARLEGKSRKFVLVSGHYDSWYEGVTDNGVANAAMMEMARVFKEHQSELDRSVVFAWWSGHSDGRYSGSAWYYDHHWQELQEDCRFVHICFGQEVLSLRMQKGTSLPLGSEALSPCGAELMRIVLPTFDAGVIERLRGYYERWPDFDIQLDVMPSPLLEVEVDYHGNVVASTPINR